MQEQVRSSVTRAAALAKEHSSVRRQAELPVASMEMPATRNDTAATKDLLYFQSGASSFWASRFYLDEHRPLHLSLSNSSASLCIASSSILSRF